MAGKIMTVRPRLAAFALAFIATAASAGLEITQYTEDFTPQGNPAFALGFPVPIAVESQVPVTGFRSYESLHARYQDLMLTNDYIQGQIVGETFNGRDIWAYQLSDENTVNMYGVPEPAMLVNGTIHVREWQTPEVLAGIMELFEENSDDHYIHQYLMENTNIILVPVNNVDGLLQTQRYPSTVIVGGDDVSSWPRDGRMRRKNMRDVDENINTVDDHLFGIDLNRNSDPFWRNNVSGTLPTINSSDDVTSLIHHGSGPFSEPESQAREAAAALGPVDKLRVYMDYHSFGQFFPWYQSNNVGLNNFTYDLMIKLREHHVQFPAGKWYFIPGISPGTFGSGGGSTDESFMERYQIPAWTPEMEPTGGGGTDYGGFGAEHDGFILPMSEVPRVRTEMAQTTWLAFYEMAGPPSVKEFQILDRETGAVIYSAEWDTISNTGRELHEYNLQPATFNREYTLWIAFDKPMFWRDEKGELSSLPGQINSGDLDLGVTVNGVDLPAETIALDATMEPGGSPRGYYQYREDAVWVDFTIDPFPINGVQPTDILLFAYDMMGAITDGDPSTIVDWQDGGWIRYEDNSPAKGNSGGVDDNYSFDVTGDLVPLPFLVEPGTSRSWYDVSHDGEGFLIEIISADSAVVYWFTYDENGNQRWFFGVGRIVGNRIIIDDLLTSAGGKFGADFDPAEVVFSSAGNATFLFDSCDSGFMKYTVDGKVGRMVIEPASSIAGLPCPGPVAKGGLLGGISGSYYDVLHDGEGFLVEILSDVLALVYWFSYDTEGNQRWFFAVGTISGDTITIDEFLTTSGGIFGPDFDPDDVVRSVWGSGSFRLNCTGGDMDYVATEPGFGSGDQDLDRITAIAGMPCP